MRTSLTETQRIEQFLLGQPMPEDRLLLEAQLRLDAGLAEKLKWQQKTYQLIREYGRRQLRQEIQAAHDQLFNSPDHAGFRQKIRSIFKKH